MAKHLKIEFDWTGSGSIDFYPEDDADGLTPAATDDEIWENIISGFWDADHGVAEPRFTNKAELIERVREVLAQRAEDADGNDS